MEGPDPEYSGVRIQAPSSRGPLADRLGLRNIMADFTVQTFTIIPLMLTKDSMPYCFAD